MNWLDTVNDGSMFVLLWVGTPIQFLFVGLYATRKWTKYTFSRALMWKSVALALYMYAGWTKIMVAGLRPVDWPTWIDVQTPIINLIVFVAIVNQLRALLVEIAAGDRNSTETEVTDKAHEQ